MCAARRLRTYGLLGLAGGEIAVIIAIKGTTTK